MCLQHPNSTNKGIHQEPAAQKSKVNPFRKGEISLIKGKSCANRINMEPASAVMAVAPILIQYGAPNSSACKSKKDMR